MHFMAVKEKVMKMTMNIGRILKSMHYSIRYKKVHCLSTEDGLNKMSRNTVLLGAGIC